jgi:hypothetical protein
MISRIDVYNYIAEAIDRPERPVSCSARREPVFETFPACSIVQLNDSSISRNYTLNYDDEQVQRNFEVQVFSNLQTGALLEAEGIMNEVRSAFRRLYFKESFVGRIENTDPTIIRLVGRFHRTIGGADEMPDTETQGD